MIDKGVMMKIYVHPSFRDAIAKLSEAVRSAADAINLYALSTQQTERAMRARRLMRSQDPRRRKRGKRLWEQERAFVQHQRKLHIRALLRERLD